MLCCFDVLFFLVDPRRHRCFVASFVLALTCLALPTICGQRVDVFLFLWSERNVVDSLMFLETVLLNDKTWSARDFFLGRGEIKRTW